MPTDIRLLVATPTSGIVKAQYAFSLSNLTQYICTGQMKNIPNTNISMSVDLFEASVIHAGRELLVNRAIKRGDTHLLFIDDDMFFEPEAVDIMLGRRLDVVTANYPIKKFPVEFVATSLSGHRIVTTHSSTGLEEIMFTGFGLSVFTVEAFKAIQIPRFLPEYMPDKKAYTTEDVPCFKKLREAGIKCYVDHDASKLVKHYGNFPYRWDLWYPKDEVAVDELPLGPKT